MELREIGESGINITPMILGTWAIGGWWWGGSDDDKAIEAINTAIDNGINCIDTAPVYGFGRSEKVVGEAISGRRDEVFIATKCGLRWDEEIGEYHFHDDTEELGEVDVYRNLNRDGILWECEQSLRRLGIEVIDLYQCHWPDESTPIEETMGALMELKEQGMIRAIGVSNFTPEMIEECLQYGEVHSSQPKYSLIDPGSMDEVIPYCAEHDIASIVYSPLEQGLLTGKVTPDREFAEGDKRANKVWFQEPNLLRALEVIDEVMQPVADEKNCTLAQLTIAVTAAQPGITAPIVGARNKEQAEQNAGAMNIEVTDDERDRITEALGALEPIED
ncbi:MAG: aldo/keto reductase [Armatimonadota bacterium]